MNELELEVLGEYEKTLIIPDKKPEKLFILCPVGLVGAGKTTVVKPLAGTLSLVRISSDEIRKLLKEKGLAFDNLPLIARSLGEKYVKLGYSIAIDSDCVSEHTQKFIKRAETEFGAQSIWIHINPPEEFIIHKLRNFKHTWLFKDSDEAIDNYFRRKPLHEKLPMSFLYRFDTSKENIGDQIAEAIELIRHETSGRMEPSRRLSPNLRKSA